MGNLLIRRRELILPSTLPNCPYITDGLIFWLDGIERGGVAGKWKDQIGGKVFDLHDCTESADGVNFAGSSTSYADYAGAISSDWNSETIEIATDASDWKNACLLCPPKIGTTGIGLIVASGNWHFNINIDGASKSRWASSSRNSRVSANKNAAVVNGSNAGSASADSWGANTTGITYLGIRQNKVKPYKGTIHSVRIYNRQLSADEMKANQAVDAARFNL